MLLLALDTSSPLTSVCLLDDGRVRAEFSVRAARPQEADHLSVVQTALRAASASLADVQAFAGTVGPGSFTGLRVGLSLLKGFTADHLRPLYGVSTLHALARTVDRGKEAVVPCIDAKKSEVYAAAYLDDRAIIPEGAYSPEAFRALADNALKAPSGSLWLGDGARLYGSAFEAPGRSFASAIFDHPRAAAVAQLGWEAWQRGDAPAADTLVPVYHRLSEAEKNKGSQKKLGEKRLT